ncbi:MAG: YbaB/EbfC family nucleoid-associated protein [Clostridia bacterium]|nr:YbaB/EbfC family nucleoid-associated protein [Clostridia bacterium]
MSKGFRGGFGQKSGGGNNMQKMMQQAQQLQREMQKEQEALAETEFEGTSGGGMVKVVMNGSHKLTSIEIKPEVVDPDDVEMLEDLIAAAFNDCSAKIEAANEEKMGKYTQGLPF